MLSHLKIYIILFLDSLDVKRSTGNLSSTMNYWSEMLAIIILFYLAIDHFLIALQHALSRSALCLALLPSMQPVFVVTRDVHCINAPPYGRATFLLMMSKTIMPVSYYQTPAIRRKS